MEKDARLLAEKTSQCFNIIDLNDPATMDNSDFESCLTELESLEAKYDSIYKEEEQSKAFGKLYIEELKKTDMPPELMEYLELLFSLSSEDVLLDGDTPLFSDTDEDEEFPDNDSIQ